MSPNTPFSPFDPNQPPAESGYIAPSSRPRAPAEAWSQPVGDPYTTQNTAGPASQPVQPYIQPQPHWPAYMHENPANYRPSRPQFSPRPNFQQQPHEPGYAAATPAAYKSRKLGLKTVLVATVALLLIAGGSVFAFLALQKDPTPDAVFKASLENALRTSSYTQQTSLKADNLGSLSYDSTQKVDLKNVKDAHVSANAKLKTSMMSIDFDGYGTYKKSYFKINNADGDPPLSKDLLGKWVEVDATGGDASTADSLSIMQDVYDPNYAVLGDYIFGNFSSAQRDELVKYALGNKLYSYDPAKVTKANRDGTAVYVYKVKTDEKKLQEYNKKAATMMGIGADKLGTADAFLEPQGVTMEVSIKDKRLVHVTLGEGSVAYSGWDATTLPQAPKAELTFDEFNAATGAAGASPSSASSTSKKAEDAERKADIDSLQTHLEAEYANYGYYPTLAELNSSSWRSSHMEGVDSGILKDPSGTSAALKSSPAKNSYAYTATAADGVSACDNITTYCDNYVLTAVLSDGTAFTQKALNSSLYDESTFSE